MAMPSHVTYLLASLIFTALTHNFHHLFLSPEKQRAFDSTITFRPYSQDAGYTILTITTFGTCLINDTPTWVGCGIVLPGLFEGGTEIREVEASLVRLGWLRVGYHICTIFVLLCLKALMSQSIYP
jgi:hypothetical protein